MKTISSLPPLSEKEIIQNQLTDITYISIICITFNHGKFIANTLDSFLGQKTKYKYEIIIHDDASTDGTQDIISQYHQAYPDIIKPIFQIENQYSKGIKPFDICRLKSKGKYIAICEGDDFWCDPHKLEKQIDFLENNPDYIVSTHNACIIDNNNKLISESKLNDICKKDFSSKELIKTKGFILTLTWVFRNIDFGPLPEKSHVINEDTFFTSVLGLYGKSKFHSDIIPAAYRIHENGVWSSTSNDEKLTSIVNTFYWLQCYHHRVNSGWSDYFLLLHFKYTCKRIFMHKKKPFIKILFKQFFCK
ncbi:glycosyltransferase family 2 protein [Providencia rettgeri]|uniref:glycosyltransferase family 2 protein n=1 Tax=Providencia rettgeri TaxID=587 RepID=UPI000F7AD728|nr:glycosyltransferase [Providencia rettgeri]MBV2188985.1 glycosyltransferase [Providencia rettgeri]